MTTRQSARKAVAQLIEDLWTSGASTAIGTVTTMPDTLSLRFVNRGAYYENAYLLRTGGAADPGLTVDDRVRRVSIDVPATGVLTVDPAWAVLPPSGTPYELWPSWDPRRVEEALNLALFQMPTIQMVDLLATVYNRYALSAYSWFKSADQLIEVRWGSPTQNGGEFDWHVLPGVFVDHDASSGWSFYLATARPSAGTQLRFVAWQTWADVALFTTTPNADATLVSSVPEDWLAVKAAIVLLSRPALRRTSPESAGSLQELLRELRRREALLDAKYVEPQPRRIFGPSVGPDQLVSGSTSGRPYGL